MSMAAGELLNCMSVRLAMQEAGTTKPHPSAALATRQLVKKLSVLAPSESVDIFYTLEPFHARYVRSKPGKCLRKFSNGKTNSMPLHLTAFRVG
jgi:hypothetical protein